jgi:hypothetical protein
MIRNILIAASTVISLLALQSCMVREPVRHESELHQVPGRATLVLLGRDGSLYRLPEFSVRDSVVTGSGTVENDSGSRAFTGAITFDEIEYAQIERLSIMGSLFIAMPTYFLMGAALSAVLLSDDNVRIEEYQKGSEGESCPYVHSWNGKEYVLEAETFGTALGKSLQRATRHVLSSLKPENGLVHLKISNERPETQFVDEVMLTRVRHKEGTSVVMDTRGRAWQVGALAEARRIDRGAVERGSATYTFARPAAATRALLVVTAINREMTEGLFQEAYAFIGHDALRFTRDLEKDPATIANLRAWLRRCALQVSAGGSGAARIEGRIDPEGTAVNFVRALPLDLRGIEGEELTVTLKEEVTGLWDISEVRISWDAEDGLQEKALSVERHDESPGVDFGGLTTGGDDRYCVLLPPQQVELFYRIDAANPEYAYSYCLEASGYLHLWYPSNGKSRLFAAFEYIPPSERRNFVRVLMGQSALVLPLLRGVKDSQKAIHNGRN